MKLAWLLLLVVGFLPVPAWADHTECEPEQADPATIIRVDSPDGNIVYWEERGVPAPFNTVPPVPGSGTVLGGGTWVYLEGNGVAGLQRGGEICYGTGSGPVPCLHTTLDPVEDQNCGFGPDLLIF